MTPFQKSVLVTILVGIALVQVTTIGLARGKFGKLPSGARAKAALYHRIGGMIGLTLAVLIAYYCLKLWPGGLRTTRVWAHAIIGASLLSLLLAKVTIRGVLTKYYSWLPVLGGALFIMVILQWLISAGWYFFVFPPGY